jgi:hypothetical protein
MNFRISVIRHSDFLSPRCRAVAAGRVSEFGLRISRTERGMDVSRAHRHGCKQHCVQDDTPGISERYYRGHVASLNDCLTARKISGSIPPTKPFVKLN